VDASERDSGLRLAELVGAFSLVTDLDWVSPWSTSCDPGVIAARLGDHMGVELDERAALYYAATLAWVGCVAETPEVAAWFADDIAFRHDSLRGDLAGLPMLGLMLRHVGRELPCRIGSAWRRTSSLPAARRSGGLCRHTA
jgi:hypothetical protein